MEVVKKVNGFTIKLLDRWEMNDILVAKGDWPIEYYVPGRVLRGYFITINRTRYYFENLANAEEFCMKYNLSDLKKLSHYELSQILCTTACY